MKLDLNRSLCQCTEGKIGKGDWWTAKRREGWGERGGTERSDGVRNIKRVREREKKFYTRF